MTIDCTNLKPGDKVRLKNGDIESATRIVRSSKTVNFIYVSNGQICHGNGEYDAYEDAESEFDIVEILTNPEPEMDTFPPLSWNVFSDGTLELNGYAFKDPMKITINGKRYVAAPDPNLCYPIPPATIGFARAPITTVDSATNEVIAITYNGKRFTPADSWPEPIVHRSPTLQDANEAGDVQLLDGDGDWMRYAWDNLKKPNFGWARTSDWKPRPIDKKTLLLQDLKLAREAGIPVSHGALDAAIELLEEAP